nr:ComEC/Rec2 family competence protein [Mesomycoplasma neurolyticum]
MKLQIYYQDIKTFEIKDKIEVKYEIFKDNFLLEYKNKKILIFSKNIRQNSFYFADLLIEKINNDPKNNYWFSQEIFYKVSKINKLEFANKNINFLTQIQDFILNSKKNYLKFIPLLLLGKNYLENNEVVNILKKIQIYHLFVISGFHIGFIKVIFFKFLSWTKIKNWIIFILFLIFSFFYLTILNFPISAIRAFVFLFLIEINKNIFNKKYKNYEILIFVGLVFIVKNIYIIFSISFILSFFISLIIILIINLKIKSKILNFIFISIFANIASFFILNFFGNYNYNVFSIFNSIIFTPFISFFYIFTLIFFWSKNFLDFICGNILYFLTIISNYQIIIEIPIPKKVIILFVIVHFLFLPLIKKNEKKFNK